MATFTYTLDKTEPDANYELGNIDDQFQQLKRAIIERNNTGHIWDYGEDAEINTVDGADTGKHRGIIFGVTYADGNDAFDSAEVLSGQTALYPRYTNDSVDDDPELFWYDLTNDPVQLTRQGKIYVPFDDIYFGLDDEDALLDFGSVMAEEYFVYSGGICDLVDGGLFDSSDVGLVEDYDDPLTDGEISYERGITADKLNPRKGKFVDGETLQIVDNGVGGKMLAVRPLSVPDSSSDPGVNMIYPSEMLYPLMVSGEYTGAGTDLNLVVFPDGYTIDYIDIKNSDDSHIRLQFGNFGTRGSWMSFTMAGAIIDYATEATVDQIVPVISGGNCRILTLKNGYTRSNYNGKSYNWTAFGHFVG